MNLLFNNEAPPKGGAFFMQIFYDGNIRRFKNGGGREIGVGGQ